MNFYLNDRAIDFELDNRDLNFYLSDKPIDFILSGRQETTDGWILTTGIWDDSEYWDDLAYWKDFPN